MSSRIRIMIAERNELLRESLVLLLNSQSDFQVIDRAENGKDLLERMKKSEPDIILLATEMPIMGGKATLDVIQRRFPSVRVIAIGEPYARSQAADMMAGGACSYLTKDCKVEIMIKAIRTVHTEDYYFDASMSKAMLGVIIKEKTANERLEGVTFNKREKEVMMAICEEKSNKEIAAELNLSASTIDFHRSRIYAKAKCKNVVGLVKFAILKGLFVLSYSSDTFNQKVEV